MTNHGFKKIFIPRKYSYSPKPESYFSPFSYQSDHRFRPSFEDEISKPLPCSFQVVLIFYFLRKKTLK